VKVDAITTGSEHYKQGGLVEPLHLIESQKLEFHLANVVKYVVRLQHRRYPPDLRKAIWYLERYAQIHGIQL
jgi:hypothetical protein